MEAGRRATSVYLVQRVIPMLPPLLCEELCSLNPGVERLAFSVVWDMDAEGGCTVENKGMQAAGVREAEWMARGPVPCAVDAWLAA